MKRTTKPDCYECVHRRPIPGDCHSRCVAPTGYAVGDTKAEMRGWWTWPLNFDPVWLVKCSGYTPISEPEEPSDV